MDRPRPVPPNRRVMVELDGVGQQVAKHLSDPGAVTHEHAARIRRALHDEVQSLVLGPQPHDIQRRGQGFVQIKRARLQIQVPGLDLGHVQNV